MRSRYVGGVDLESLLDAGSSVWGGSSGEAVKLMGTPVGLQPTAAIRSSWMGREIGAVGSVSVSSVHDGSVLAFRLEWADAEEDVEVSDTTSFPDGAAVLLPSVPGAPAMTMGAPGSAVTAWYWRADDAGGRGRHVVAEGLGTTRAVDEGSVRSRGEWKEGRWRVVLARPLRVESGEPVAQLEVGGVTGFGVAVWEGSRGERAGIKAFSGDWQELRIESPATARR
jgi:DMSO reductase family type II enzyme heme b subunit